MASKTLNFIWICLLLILSCSDIKIPNKKLNINNYDWKFHKGDLQNAFMKNYDDSNWLKISIPHDWNGGVDGINSDIFNGPDMYLGVGWYRVKFKIDEKYSNKDISIFFEAANSVTDVWLNEEYLGKHKGGYTGFNFDVTKYLNFNKINTLAVKVNNSNDSTVAPWMYKPFEKFPNSSDYPPYGGIYRDVWIDIRNQIKVNRTLITTHKEDNGRIIQLKCIIENKKDNDSKINIKTEIFNDNYKLIASTKKKSLLKDNLLEVEELIHINNPNFWSLKNPHLYTAKISLFLDNLLLDETKTKFGIRDFHISNGEPFILNGEKVFLRGINRHQDKEGFGYALSNKQHLEDIKLIKDYGFNFLRHAHYPADQSVLDACDSLGILVWLEIPVSTCIAPNSGFLKNAKSQLTEMILENFNHPSVIVWGLGNESDRAESSSESYSNYFFKELNLHAKKFDTTKPTVGCNFIYESNQKIVDVYAPQDWSGWYDEVEHGYENYKPNSIIGEYGASIHLLTHNEFGFEKKWSQEYGCLLHEFKVAKGEEMSDHFPGHVAWVAFDFASPIEDRVTNPIPYMNMKGLFLHDHKTPKDVAYFYKSFYTSAEDNPMVYIVLRSIDSMILPVEKTIWVYSNCEEVELINGLAEENNYGKRKKDSGPLNNTRFQWDNIFIEYNSLVAQGYINNMVVASDTIKFGNQK